MNNRVFISGKVSGDPNYRNKFQSAALRVCQPDFFNRHGIEAAQRLGSFGFQPVDPCDFTFLGHPMADCTRSLCMAMCLWHLAGCSYVYVLRDWPLSRGARIEHRVARLLHKRIIYQ